MALSFAEWDKQGQPQQPAGSSASAPSFQQWSQGQGGGAPSFQQWSQNPQAPAAPRATIDPNKDVVWNGLTQNQIRQLSVGGLADSPEIRDLMMNDPVMKGLVESGKIKVSEEEIQHAATGGETPTGEWTSHQWNFTPTIELPKLPQGYNLAVDKDRGYNTGATWNGGVNLGPMIYDPVYGAMRTATTKRDIMDKLAPMLAMGMAMGPIAGTLGPMLGNALGLPAGLGTAAIKAVPGLVMSGGKSLGSTAASFLGSATGLPMGGQLGSLAYNAAIGNKIDPARAGLGMAPSFASWLANQGG